MVDSITEGDVKRIKNRVPTDLKEEEDIKDYLNSKFDAFPGSAIEEFSEQVAERRTPREQSKERSLKSKTAISGAGVTGKRTTMLRDAEGHYFGAKSKVKTYEDRWGNVMGYNPETGKRKKIVDSEEVNN